MATWNSQFTKIDSSVRANETRTYFAAKADFYDDTDNQPYWVFSDDLLWHLLKKLVLSKYDQASTIHLLDAGAGTARWSSRILQHLPSCSATLIDISPEMLNVAKKKLQRLGMTERATIVEADLQTLEGSAFGQHDLIICFHNVLSFVSDPAHVIEKLFSALKSGGTLVLVVPNYYHALYFSISQRRWSELERIIQRASVKFNDSVPEMLLFTPGSLIQTLRQCGCLDTQVLGFPISIYPQIEETYLQGSNSFALSLFSNAELREQLFKIEAEVCLNTEAAARGNNLLVIANKA